jgi:serine acetyltransferase
MISLVLAVSYWPAGLWAGHTRRCLQVLAVDLHPAARLGHGILLDHGTGVVIGETAVIGNNVSLLQVRRCNNWIVFSH